ncbi:MAG: hypothetical protein V5A62_17965 [Haloarculaceae archaeon]
MVDDSDGGSGGDAPAGGDPEPTGRKTDVLDALREGPTRFVPPRTEAARRELREGDREILHCLDCGRQVVARRHGGACLLCGSEAVIVESV